MKNIYLIPTDKPTRLFTSDSELILAGYPATTFRTGKSLYITSDEEIEEGDWFYDLDTKYTKIKQSFENSHLDFNAKKIIMTTDVDLIKDDVQALDDEFLKWFVENPSCEEAKVEITEISCIIPNFGDVDKYRIAIPKQESKTAWVGVLHDKLNEYHPAEYELKDIYQGEGCLPNFPNEELCQIWCDSKYKEVSKGETNLTSERETMKEETIEEAAERLSIGIREEDYKDGFIEGAKWQKEQYTIEEQHIGHSIDEVSKEYIKGFNEGSDWQQEQDKKLYSIEDMLLAFETGRNFQLTGENNFKELIEHLKK